jgi:hypothetical protein
MVGGNQFRCDGPTAILEATGRGLNAPVVVASESFMIPDFASGADSA